MSSTNRSKARDTHISDYYVTPVEDIKLFLRELNVRERINWADTVVVDPCAGGNLELKDNNGIINMYHPMSYPLAIKETCGEVKRLYTYDIREDSLAGFKENYLQAKLEFKPDVIITNPPFSIALQIIEKALRDVKPDGLVIMLLRLNFFGSKDRFPFFKEYLPKWCFIHHKRISFIDKKDNCGYTVFDENGVPKKGATDSIEYCHMVFQKGICPEFTQLVVI